MSFLETVFFSAETGEQFRLHVDDGQHKSCTYNDDLAGVGSVTVDDLSPAEADTCREEVVELRADIDWC